MAWNCLEILMILPHNEIDITGILSVCTLIEDGLSEEDLNKWSSFWDYFKRKWWTDVMIPIWNIHGVDEDYLYLKNRTNNALEWYNRRFNEIFPAAHQKLLLLIQLIED